MHPVLFRIGDFEVGTYGLLLTLGFFAALWLASRLGRKNEVGYDAISDLSITVLMAGIVGSKLLMIIVDLFRGAALSDVFSLSTLRAGGAVHGGIILGTAAFFWRMHKWKLPFGKTLDVLTPAVALGQAIGRLGCTAAGCCWGKACELPWAVSFTEEEAHRLSGTPLHLHLHPVQLYTFVTELLIMGLLVWRHKKRGFYGEVGALFFMLEGLGRIILEYWRGDADRGIWLNMPWLSTGRLTGLGFIVFGIILYCFFRKKARTDVGEPEKAIS